MLFLMVSIYFDKIRLPICQEIFTNVCHHRQLLEECKHGEGGSVWDEMPFTLKTRWWSEYRHLLYLTL